MVRQEYLDEKGLLKVSERKYPIFAHAPPYMPTQVAHWPVRLITEANRKEANASDELWRDYEENYILNAKSVKWDKLFVYLMPPVRENSISIWVYDRAGNKSNIVQVHNELKEYQPDS